jgi:hypothetical protein
VGKTLVGSVVGTIVDVGATGIEASGRFTGGTFTTPPEFTGKLAGGKMLGKSATRLLRVPSDSTDKFWKECVVNAFTFPEKIPRLITIPRKLMCPNFNELG